MSVTNRFYGWNATNLGIYVDKGDAHASIVGSPYLNLLTLFKQARLRTSDTDFEGRATAETWAYPIPIFSEWSMEVGAVADASLPTLLSLRLDPRYGRGPYWAVAILSLPVGAMAFYGRVLISNAGLDIPDGAVTQEALLKGVGALTYGYP